MRYQLLALVMGFALVGCSQATTAPAIAPTSTTTLAAAKAPHAPTGADLNAIKTYARAKATSLNVAANELKKSSDQYYQLAQTAKFDYAALWSSQKAETIQTIEQARMAWTTASPLYEQIEGIVAGVPRLAEFDVILDAGTSAEEGGADVVPFDLILPDGRTLVKPGNLFGVTESTLWGTYDDFRAKNVQADFNGNGAVDLGDALPDANVLKAGADTLAAQTADLVNAINGWQPTEADAFTALAVMVPTMGDYFEAWKSSRFVVGDASTQRDFVAISRLSDIIDILSGLQVVYQGVSPLVQRSDPAQAAQISQGLESLKAYVGDIYVKEKAGHRYTPEDADLLGAETQNRATAITGQITQVAEKLQIKIEQ